MASSEFLWLRNGFLATDPPLLFLYSPTFNDGERTEEKSPRAEWKLVSAVVFDMIDAIEKSFCILGALTLAACFVTAIGSALTAP